MIKRSKLSPPEIDEIMEKYITKQITLEEIMEEETEKNNNLTREYIESAISKKVKDTLVDIENDLSMANKIKELKMFEYGCDNLFKQFLRIHDILPEEYIDDFKQHYDNMKVIGVELLRRGQYPYMHSDRKLQMYNFFIKYADDRGLFEQAKRTKIDPDEDMPPYADAAKVFPKRDHELIFKAFRNCGGKINMIYEGLSKMNMHCEAFESYEEFKKRFENLILIGMYEIYKEATLLENAHPVMSWRKFKAGRSINSQHSPYFLTFLRISIRKDPSIDDIKQLAGIVNKRFIMFHDERQKKRTSKAYNLIKQKIKEQIKQEMGAVAEEIKKEQERRKKDGPNEAIYVARHHLPVKKVKVDTREVL